jgi:hypothetical protein
MGESEVHNVHTLYLRRVLIPDVLDVVDARLCINREVNEKSCSTLPRSRSLKEVDGVDG